MGKVFTYLGSLFFTRFDRIACCATDRKIVNRKCFKFVSFLTYKKVIDKANVIIIQNSNFTSTFGNGFENIGKFEIASPIFLKLLVLKITSTKYLKARGFKHKRR